MDNIPDLMSGTPVCIDAPPTIQDLLGHPESQEEGDRELQESHPGYVMTSASGAGEATVNADGVAELNLTSDVLGLEGGVGGLSLDDVVNHGTDQDRGTTLEEP